MTPACARPLVGRRFVVDRADGWAEGVYEHLRRGGVPVAPPAPNMPTWDGHTGTDADGEWVHLRAELTQVTVARASALGVFLIPR